MNERFSECFHDVAADTIDGRSEGIFFLRGHCR
jgi:hypothetical protein